MWAATLRCGAWMKPSPPEGAGRTPQEDRAHGPRRPHRHQPLREGVGAGSATVLVRARVHIQLCCAHAITCNFARLQGGAMSESDISEWWCIKTTRVRALSARGRWGTCWGDFGGSSDLSRTRVVSHAAIFQVAAPLIFASKWSFLCWSIRPFWLITSHP